MNQQDQQQQSRVYHTLGKLMGIIEQAGIPFDQITGTALVLFAAVVAVKGTARRGPPCTKEEFLATCASCWDAMEKL